MQQQSDVAGIAERIGRIDWEIGIPRPIVQRYDMFKWQGAERGTGQVDAEPNRDPSPQGRQGGAQTSLGDVLRGCPASRSTIPIGMTEGRASRLRPVAKCASARRQAVIIRSRRFMACSANHTMSASASSG